MTGIYDTETLTVRRPGVIVDSGNEYPDPENSTQVTFPGWAFEPGDQREEHDRASGHTAEFTGWGPISDDVQETDEVDFTYAGRVYTGYAVDGRPRLFPDPLKIDSHQQIALIKREG